jgi:predicted DNA-binding transcriptional regulator YafY
MYGLKKSLEENYLVKIVYDNKGIITERTIKVLAIEDEKIIAFCYLRKARRTFLYKNILATELIKKEGMV